MRIILALLVVAGCTTTFRGKATQPNPMAQPLDTLRRSELIVIKTGDMDLEMPRPATGNHNAAVTVNDRYPLYNTAYFSVISRDRVKVHVQIDHKWEEFADLKTWDVSILTNTGPILRPDSVDRSTRSMITKMWDREQQTAVRNQYGDIVALNNDGWKNRQSLGSLSVYRGKATFSFYRRDLFTAKVKLLKLVVRRPGVRFVFVWRFED